MNLTTYALLGALIGCIALGTGIAAGLQFYDQPALVEHLHPCPTTESPRSWPRVVEQPAAWPVSVEPLTLGPRGDGPCMGQQSIKTFAGIETRTSGRPGRRAGAAFGGDA